MVSIKDKNRVFQHPDQMLSYLLNFLTMMVEKEGGTVRLENIEDGHNKNVIMLVDFNVEEDAMMITVEEDHTSSNGKGVQ